MNNRGAISAQPAEVGAVSGRISFGQTSCAVDQYRGVETRGKPGRGSLNRVLHARHVWTGLALLLMLGAATIVGASLGALVIPFKEILAIITGKMGIETSLVVEPVHETVFWMIRLPRVAGAILIGMALSLAGAMVQGLFRNPLAEPGLIGTSSGAAIAGAAYLILAPTLLGKIGHDLEAYLMPLAAFSGALLTTYAVYKIAVVERRTQIATLLLTGVALNALVGAGLGILLYLADDLQQRSINFWLFGSLNGIGWGQCAVLAAVTIPILIVACLKLSPYLDAYALGESEAHHLGVPLELVKVSVIIGASLIVGAGVAFAGVIAFVGLVVPHIIRLICGPSHRHLLLFSALLGGLMLLLADILARTVVAPAELPIGAITSLVGAPFFLLLILKQRRHLLV